MKTNTPRPLIFAAVTLALGVAAASCGGARTSKYVKLSDARLSFDGDEIILHVERGRETTTPGNFFGGDHTEQAPESHETHIFNRHSHELGSPADAANSAADAQKPQHVGAYSGVENTNIPHCRSVDTECAQNTQPNPFLVDDPSSAWAERVVDPLAAAAILEIGGRVQVVPFQMPSTDQASTGRQALLLRAIEAVHRAAIQGRKHPPSTSDPNETQWLNLVLEDASLRGVSLGYALRPQAIHATVDYDQEPKVNVVWISDGACFIDSKAIAAQMPSCRFATPEGVLASFREH